MKRKLHYLLPIVAAAGALFLSACGEKAEEDAGEEKAAPKAEEKGEAKG